MIILPESHLYISMSKKIANICEPLQKIGITMFTFMRNYNDHSRIYLSNNAKWVKDYYELALYESSLFENDPNLYQDKMNIWPLGQNVLDLNVIQHGMNNFNSTSGITLIKYHINYCDFFFFSGPAQPNDSINSYVNNLDILEKFCVFFINKINDDMYQLEQNKIIVPLTKVQLISNSDKIIRCEVIEQIGEMNNQVTNSYFKELTPMEKKYFVEFVSGKTASQISKQFSRSRRTIEKHLENIKGKLNCSNKWELVLRFSQYQFS